MPDDNKKDENWGKWGAPTSSYEDAQSIKKFVKKMKDQKAQDQKDDDKPSSWSLWAAGIMYFLVQWCPFKKIIPFRQHFCT